MATPGKQPLYDEITNLEVDYRELDGFHQQYDASGNGITHGGPGGGGARQNPMGTTQNRMFMTMESSMMGESMLDDHEPAATFSTNESGMDGPSLKMSHAPSGSAPKGKSRMECVGLFTQVLHLLVNIGILMVLVIVTMNLQQLNETLKSDSFENAVDKGISKSLNTSSIQAAVSNGMQSFVNDDLQTNLSSAMSGAIHDALDSDAMDDLGESLGSAIGVSIFPSLINQISGSYGMAGILPETAAYFFASDYSKLAATTSQVTLALKQIIPSMLNVNWEELQQLNMTLIQVDAIAKIVGHWNKFQAISLNASCTNCSMLEAIEENFAVHTWAELAPTCEAFAHQMESLPWNSTNTGDFDCFHYTTEASFAGNTFPVSFTCPNRPVPSNRYVYQNLYRPCQLGCCHDVTRPTCCYSGGKNGTCPDGVDICGFDHSVIDPSHLQIGVTYTFSSNLACSSQNLSVAYCQDRVPAFPRDSCTYRYSAGGKVRQWIERIAKEMKTVCRAISTNQTRS